MFRKKLTTVDRWMKGTRLPSHLQRRIKSFYAEVCGAKGLERDSDVCTAVCGRVLVQRDK